jgi:hypothetical protein
MSDANDWAFMLKEPTIAKAQDLIVILQYAVSLYRDDASNPMNDPDTLVLIARRAKKVRWNHPRVKFIELPSHSSSHDPGDRKATIDYWVKTIQRSIDEVLSCQTDRDAAIWLERRMGDEARLEQLDRWQVSEKKVASTLARIDALLLQRYQLNHNKNKNI